jgi:hypothetical protein
MFKRIRDYENLHIALWLMKDTCWVMTWRLAGMVMIAPTLFVAIHIAYKSRHRIDELFHNIAVCLWITANAIWMTGEFFANDTYRPYARIFFVLGLIAVFIYYVVFFPKKNRQASAEPEVAVDETSI